MQQPEHIKSEGKLSYDHCGKTIPCSSNLQQHQCVHTAEKVCLCDSYGKQDATSSVLEREKQSPAGDNLNLCENRGKLFAESSSPQQQEHLDTEPIPIRFCHQEPGSGSGTMISDTQETGGIEETIPGTSKPDVSDQNCETFVESVHSDSKRAQTRALQGSFVDTVKYPSWTAGCRDKMTSDREIYHNCIESTERMKESSGDRPIVKYLTVNAGVDSVPMCKEGCEMGWSQFTAQRADQRDDSLSGKMKVADECRDHYHSQSWVLNETEVPNSDDLELQLAEHGCPMELEHVIKVEIQGSDCVPGSDTEKSRGIEVGMWAERYNEDISLHVKQNHANDVPYIKQEETTEEDW